MAGRFETYVRGWRLAFNGANGRAFLGGMAAVLGDRAELEARQAVREGFATEGSDETALGLLGADVGIDRGPSGYDTGYRDRVARAITQSRWYGRDLGLLVALHYSGFAGGVVVGQNGTFTELTGTPVLDDLEDADALPSWATFSTAGNFNPPIPLSTDGKPAIPGLTVPWVPFAANQMDADGNQHNGRFAVVFPDALPAPMDLSIAANLTRIRRVIAKWRPASKSCYGIYVITPAGSSVWDYAAGRTWDDAAGAWWDVPSSTFYTA